MTRLITAIDHLSSLVQYTDNEIGNRKSHNSCKPTHRLIS